MDCKNLKQKNEVDGGSLQVLDCHKLNQGIIVASFKEKGERWEKEVRNDLFFLFLSPPVSFKQGFLSAASFLKLTRKKMHLDAAVIFK